MAFGIGTNTKEPDAGEVTGTQIEVACECWFTSTGKMIPLMLKVQDADGELHIIKKIEVHSSDKKKYAGIPSVEFDCTIMMLEKSFRAKLIFYQTESRWVLTLK